MDVLIIGGHFSLDHADAIHHVDDFRLKREGVPMSVPNLVDYFRRGRSFPKETLAARRLQALRRPSRQLYWSGLHLLDLLSRAGFEATLLNCHDLTDPERWRFLPVLPRCIVISTTFMTLDAVEKTVADVKGMRPDAFVVVGGNLSFSSWQVLGLVHDPEYQRDEVKNAFFFTRSERISGIDCYIVDPHGEETLLAVVTEVVRGKGQPGDLPNTVVPRREGFHCNPLVPEKFDINSHRIHWRNIPRRCLASVVPIQNSFGCPFRCQFCNFSQTKVQRKSLDALFDELRELANHPVVRKIWFTDDNFLLTERLVAEFCQRYAEEGFQFPWMSFIRASSITPRTAELLARSRCEMLILGLESASPEILANMGKRDSVENYRRAVSLLIEHGIDTELSFIIGFPGESASTVDETIRFLVELPVNPIQKNYLYLFRFHVAPLAPVFATEARRKWGLEGVGEQWRHRTMTSDQAMGELRRVAMVASNTVFNYLDPVDDGLERENLVHLMRLRDEVARSELRSGESAATTAAWHRLEEATRRQFPRAFTG